MNSSGDRSAVLVQTCRESIVVVRPIEIVLDVLFTSPHHLDRTRDLLRDLHRPDDEIDLKPTAEAPAEEVIMDVDFLRRKAGRLAAAAWAKCGTCVPTQTSQPSRRTWTVQLTGSTVAWARNGSS